MTNKIGMDNLEFKLLDNTLSETLDFNMPKKLEAEDYNASEFTSGTESASGSGNLNYLMLQSQQTYENGNILSGRIGNLEETIGAPSVDNAFAARNQGSTAQGSLLGSISNGEGISDVFSISNNMGAYITSPISSGESNDLSIKSFSNPIVTGSEQFSRSGGSSSLGDSYNEQVTINNFDLPDTPPDGENPTPPDNDSEGDDGPLLVVDVDTDLGKTLNNVLDDVGEVTSDVIDVVGDIINSDISDLATEVVDNVSDVVTTVNTLVDTTQGVVGNVTDSLTNVLNNGLSFTELLLNLETINNLASDLLGTNNLSIGGDLNGVVAADATVEFGDSVLPNAGLNLNPVIGTDAIDMDTDSLTEALSVNSSLDYVDNTISEVVGSVGLTSEVDAVENVLNDTLGETANLLSNVVDEVQTVVDDIQENLDEPTEEMTDILEAAVNPVEEALEPIDDVVSGVEGSTEPVLDLADNLTGGLTENLSDVLSLGGSDAADDSDIVLVGQTDTLDSNLDIAEEVNLDPVENLIGDIDVDVTGVLSSGGDSDIGIVADVEAVSPEDSEILNADGLGEDVSNPETIISDLTEDALTDGEDTNIVEGVVEELTTVVDSSLNPTEDLLTSDIELLEPVGQDEVVNDLDTSQIGDGLVTEAESLINSTGDVLLSEGDTSLEGDLLGGDTGLLPEISGNIDNGADDSESLSEIVTLGGSGGFGLF